MIFLLSSISTYTVLYCLLKFTCIPLTNNHEMHLSDSLVENGIKGSFFLGVIAVSAIILSGNNSIMQVARLLMDTSAQQFYPSLFVLATDVMDLLGNLVWQRVKRKAEFSEEEAALGSLPGKKFHNHSGSL